jgi:cytidylate kinase
VEDKKQIIVIDGSSWVGKSTVAKALAKIMGYKHINTGSIYRAVAYLAKKAGVKEKEGIIKIAKDIEIDFQDNGSKIIINGEDLTEELASPEIVPFTSEISEISEVRGALEGIQKKLGEQDNTVLEGRDMGTKIFPDADWKFFIDAKDWKKAERLNKVMVQNGKKPYPEQEAIDIIKKTDERDRNRTSSPLCMAEDALYYDNTKSPTPEQDAHVIWYYITHKEEILKNCELLRK